MRFPIGLHRDAVPPFSSNRRDLWKPLAGAELLLPTENAQRNASDFLVPRSPAQRCMCIIAAPTRPQYVRWRRTIYLLIVIGQSDIIVWFAFAFTVVLVQYGHRCFFFLFFEKFVRFIFYLFFVWFFGFYFRDFSSRPVDCRYVPVGSHMYFSRRN